LVLGRQNTAGLSQDQPHFLVRVPVLAERHACQQPGIGQSLRRRLHVGDLDVAVEAFASKPDRVNRDAALANLADRLQIDAPGVVGPIAEQQGANWQAGCLDRHLFQALANMRRLAPGR
jgi:hypothetical protein